MGKFRKSIFLLEIIVAVILLISCSNEKLNYNEQLLTQDILNGAFIMPEKGIKKLHTLLDT